MKHGVTRRGDQIPLELVHTDYSVNGLVAIDMLNGRILSIQCKALIIADGGFEGAFTNGPSSLGMDLAYRAGAPLRNMEFIAETPLGVVGTNLIIPQSILSDGATLHTPSGTALETSSTTPTTSLDGVGDEGKTTSLDKPPADKWTRLEFLGEMEEELETLDGEDGLNKMFQDLYKDADDDQRRAMMKSFVESNGTVLSTDWTDVGKKFVEPQAP